MSGNRNGFGSGRGARQGFFLAGTAMGLVLAVNGALAQEPVETDFTDDGAMDEMVVFGSLTPRPAREIGSAITLIDAEKIDVTQNIIVSDLLRTVPGLAVNRTGPQGSLTQVRIRGAEGNHTLVYIDGVEAANPVFGEFNFANLVSADVERIEVIRGAQSALYGSEAIGGVIAVKTKDPEPGFRAEMEGEGGSFGTFRTFGAAGWGGARAGLRATVQHYTTNGVSTAPDGTEEDGFDSLNVSVKGLLNPADGVNVEAIFRYTDSESDGDAQEFDFGTVQDSPDRTEAEDLLAKLDVRAALIGDWLTGRAFIAYTDAENVNFFGDVQTAISAGERLKYGAHLTGDFDAGPTRHTVTAALEREELDFANALQARSDDQTSIVGEYNFGYRQQLYLSGAVRHDFNNEFDDATTYRVSAAYVVEATQTRLHASWGEGITDPTFNERFGFHPDTFIGNPDLVPERSQGWDAGIEQELFGGRAIVDVTYFNADLKDEISTSFTQDANGNFVSTPINNPGESERQGVEVVLLAQLFDGLSLDGQYTYLDATGADGLVEVRRPQHTASVNLTYSTFDGRATFNLGVDYNGEQEDLFFGFADPDFTPRKTLDAYTLVRIAASYRFEEGIEIFARGENVLDEDYVEVLGFGSTGMAGYGGLRLRF